MNINFLLDFFIETEFNCLNFEYLIVIILIIILSIEFKFYYRNVFKDTLHHSLQNM